jgi:hypothetical protein
MPVLSTPLTELLSATARPAVSASTADLSALMCRLEPAVEPAAVFKSLTRVVVPALCDASTVWISATGQRPSYISFRVAGSGNLEQRVDGFGASLAQSEPAELAGALVSEDTVALPITPTPAEGQVPYRGVFTMSFYGLRPALTHVLMGRLLVERAVALVQREQLVAKTRNLHRALSSNRDIGAAMGILMARHQLTSDQAFDLLRRTSQHEHRKIVALAAEVIETGSLELPCGVALVDQRPTPGPPRRAAHHLRLAH